MLVWKDLYIIFGTSVYKMVQVIHKWYRILECFYEYPLAAFSVRDLAGKTKLPVSTVQRYLQDMKKKKILNKDGKLWDSPSMRFRKAFFMMDKIVESGLLEILEVEYRPRAVVVFGGVRKGEYDKESDVDIFIESDKVEVVDLSKFERKIGHKIELFIRKDINDLHVNLRNNVLNGIKLAGYLDVK